MPSKIYYTKPSITELEQEYAADAAANGWGEQCYAYITRFENAFAHHLGVKYAVATSSCTGAMHMALSALGVGVGDEVILADINWIASAAPITYLGATPVFVDVDEQSWCIDPTAVEQAITPKTKAIIAVHLYGNLCDMTALLEIGHRHDIPVIEDAAEAIGSMYQEQRAGSMGACGVFSFHGTKTLTTGEGGMFVTNDEHLYKRVQTLNSHGRSAGETKQFWSSVIGYKYKMSNIQAAIGCAQLERIDQLIERKRDIFAYYQRAFKNAPVQMNPEREGDQNGYWMPTLVVASEQPFDREVLLDDFRAQNIDGRVFFWPLSMLPVFNEKSENVISYGLYNRAVNLPSYHDLTYDEQDRVISVVCKNLN